jgi:predicted RNA-binding protein with EMAP domain
MSGLKKTFSIRFLIVAVFAIIVVTSTLSTPTALGLMGTVEQVEIRNLQFVGGVEGGNDAIKVTVVNTGSMSAIITNGSAYRGGNRVLSTWSKPPFNRHESYISNPEKRNLRSHNSDTQTRHTS